MNTHTLQCTACSRDHTPDMRTLRCRECASPLAVAYPSDSEPVLNASPVSLGEGHTPVVPLPAIADSLGLNSIYAKLEFAAPTGSFKDRGTAVMLAVTREFGVEEIVEDSSGNAGASVAAYSARCGIKAHIFAPDSAPETKLRQIKVYRAELHLVPGPREAAAEAALAFCEEHSVVYASHNLSAYFLEGTKTFAHELPTNFPTSPPARSPRPHRHARRQRLPLPGRVARASRITKPRRYRHPPEAPRSPGRARYAHRRRLPRPNLGPHPRLPHHCRRHLSRQPAKTRPRPQHPPRVRRRRRRHPRLREQTWQSRLATSEGLFCEPTSAAAFAGLPALIASGAIPPTETVLVPITGSGLKDPT